MRKKLKLLSILLELVAGFIVVALAGLAWLVAPHSPDLTPERAANIISATPEFNQSRSLVAVSDTEEEPIPQQIPPTQQSSALLRATR